LTKPNLYELGRLRLFSFGGYGLALAALALVVLALSNAPLGSTGFLCFISYIFHIFLFHKNITVRMSVSNILNATPSLILYV